jgi:hypothetical protein
VQRYWLVPSDDVTLTAFRLGIWHRWLDGSRTMSCSLGQVLHVILIFLLPSLSASNTKVGLSDCNGVSPSCLLIQTPTEMPV